MTTFREQVIEAIVKQNKGVLSCAESFDKKIDELEKKLSNAEAEIKRLTGLKCGVCNSPLPADGKCRVCALKKNSAGTNEQAFALGAKAVLMVLAVARSRNLLPHREHNLAFIFEELMKRVNAMDAVEAANEVMDAMHKSGQFVDCKASEDFTQTLYKRLYGD